MHHSYTNPKAFTQLTPYSYTCNAILIESFDPIQHISTYTIGLTYIQQCPPVNSVLCLLKVHKKQQTCSLHLFLNIAPLLISQQ